VLSFATIALFAYLIGSIPAGYLVARLVGVDIRTVGSGNIGATNVLRTLGKRYGYPVFLFDFLKGVVAVKMSIFIHEKSVTLAPSPELFGILGGICCVLGHSYPIWLRFKGGKGVATSGGVVFGLMPVVAVIAGLVWIVAFQATRYVSVASIAALLSMPVASGLMLWLGYLPAPALFYFSLGLAGIVIIRHRTNLSRLAHGRESRFGRK
jgi:acyl phosphate:glycerol-3-phosphate acyltransferase